MYKNVWIYLIRFKDILVPRKVVLGTVSTGRHKGSALPGYPVCNYGGSVVLLYTETRPGNSDCNTI